MSGLPVVSSRMPAAGIRVDGELGILDPRVRGDASGRIHGRLFIADEGEDELARRASAALL